MQTLDQSPDPQLRGDTTIQLEAQSAPDILEPLPAQRKSRGGKRNKPTLSCASCVGRKSKCDRGKPACSACIRRKSVCEYTAQRVNIADAAHRSKRARVTSWSNDMADLEDGASTTATWTLHKELSQFNSSGVAQPPPTPSLSSALPSESTMFPFSFQPSLDHASHERPSLFTLFGMNRQHPFQNYWTTTGGLAEVITLLPSKEQADLLLQQYFDIIDPLYPIVPGESFMEEYSRFWTAPLDEKHLFDPAHVALQFAIYATGTQYMDTQPSDAREATSELYLSCSHQSLCISSYLNHCSLATLQTMILVCNFLIASHRISDAWTFSGLTQRQAYGLQLHRDPAVAHPDASWEENQIRCRLWQAVMFQDTSLSLYLELPPATVYHDISPSCLKQAGHLAESSWVFEDLHDQSSSSSADVSYLRAMWQYAQFAQEHMCARKALKQPISDGPTNKAELVSRMRELYSNFDSPFNTYEPSRFENQPPRLARQLISLSSNFFYALTVLCMDSDEATGLQCDVYGALEASHEAMAAYFALSRLFPVQTDTWGAAQTRAYAQASMIARILADQSSSPMNGPRDPRLMLAKSNVDRYIDILVRTGGSAEFDNIRLGRLADLQGLRDRIIAV